MKTAEQWAKGVFASDDSLTIVMREAMLDAYRQGCTDAAKLASLGINANGHEATCHCLLCEYRSALITLRDRKKLEEM